jgi:hypothetical protein
MTCLQRVKEIKLTIKRTPTPKEDIRKKNYFKNYMKHYREEFTSALNPYQRYTRRKPIDERERRCNKQVPS